MARKRRRGGGGSNTWDATDGAHLCIYIRNRVNERGETPLPTAESIYSRVLLQREPARVIPRLPTAEGRFSLFPARCARLCERIDRELLPPPAKLKVPSLEARGGGKRDVTAGVRRVRMVLMELVCDVFLIRRWYGVEEVSDGLEFSGWGSVGLMMGNSGWMARWCWRWERCRLGY